MSNLSEEKIIHSLKYLVEEYNRVTQLYGDFFISKTEIDEIQGLLELYQKEKEKNENLSCDRILIQENVYKEIKEKIENINNYINKNKLFELLEIDNIDVIHCRLKQILEE